MSFSPSTIDVIVPTLIVTSVALAIMLLLLRRQPSLSFATFLGTAVLIGIVSAVAVYVSMIFLPPACANIKSN
jgi:hypothetical protein